MPPTPRTVLPNRDRTRFITRVRGSRPRQLGPSGRQLLPFREQAVPQQGRSALVGRSGQAKRADVTSVPAPASSSWNPLYRLGGLAASAAVALYVVALVLVSVTEFPPSSGGADLLQYVAEHRMAYIVRQLLWLVPSLLMMVVFTALAVALRHHGRAFAALAGLFSVSSWVISLAWPTTGDGSLAMVLLSDKYVLAAAEAERAAYVAGAELLTALNDIPQPIGIVQTFGILLIALLMLRGTFSRGLARLGVVTGAVGVVSEILRPIMGPSYAIYGILLFVWLAWVARALLRHTEPASA